MADGPLIRVPKQREIRVRQDGTNVVLLIDGAVAFETHWRFALDVGRALTTKARAAMDLERKAKAPPAGPTIVGIPGIGPTKKT